MVDFNILIVYYGGMEINFNADKLAGAAKKFSLKFVILHGSFATGLARKDSDFDIAVLGRKDVSFKQLLELDRALPGVFNFPPNMDLDLKALNKVDPLFRHEVVRDGKLLYGDPVEYEEYKAFTERAYEDARPLLDLEEHLVKKFQVHLNSLYAQ